MVRRSQVLVMAALLLLNSCPPSLAFPIASIENTDDSDMVLLLATGVLSQEKRLKAIEQRLDEMASVQAATTTQSSTGRAQGTGGWRESRVKAQQSLDERKELSLDTRIEYLEQDVVDNWHFLTDNLNQVRDQGAWMVQRESEDVRELHKELADNVELLEREINATLRSLENEIVAVNARVDAVKEETEDNMYKYFRVNNGLHEVINYITAVDDTLWGLIYDVQRMNSTLRELIMRHEHETEHATEPSVGPIGQTGGGVQYTDRYTADAAQGVMEWLNKEKALNDAADQNKEATAQEESESESEESDHMTAFEELLHELMKFNM